MAERVEIDWPSGRRQEAVRLPADAYYLLTESSACVPDPRLARTARSRQ